MVYGLQLWRWRNLDTQPNAVRMAASHRMPMTICRPTPMPSTPCAATQRICGNPVQYQWVV